MEKRAFGEAQVKTSLDKAFMLKKRLGERRWQDVLTEVITSYMTYFSLSGCSIPLATSLTMRQCAGAKCNGAPQWI